MKLIRSKVARTMAEGDEVVEVVLACGHKERMQKRFARWMAACGLCPECIKEKALAASNTAS